jgi:prepilin-type N-terminal cleavage/methylation domain-containing protein/prepilin-type processing-associated H-X9-DG protein
MDSSRRSSTTPRGVTLIEIAVVMGIVAILATLITAGVLQSRSAARRMECASQLKQIALAINSFEAARGHYPKETTNGRQTWDLQQQLAGYLEVSDLEHAYRPSAPLLACPADPEAVGRLASLWGSYWMSEGSGDVSAPDGVSTFRGPPVKARDVTDGLSNTAMCSEKLAYPKAIIVDWSQYPEYRNRVLLTTPRVGATLDERADECEYRAGLPIYGYFVYTAYTHILPPNRNHCVVGYLPGGMMMINASSLHGGGANLALADGSVRFASERIDRRVWQHIGKRNDGEGTVAW